MKGHFNTLALGLASLLTVGVMPIEAELTPKNAVLFLDFDKTGEVQLFEGARVKEGHFGKALEFTSALQYAETEFSNQLDRIEAMSVGGWFFPYRSGEQSFFFVASQKSRSLATVCSVQIRPGLISSLAQINTVFSTARLTGTERCLSFE